MKKQRKRSFAILLVLLFSVMLLQPLSMKVKAEENSIPQYLDYTKGFVGFAYQWKNKSFLVVQDNTRQNTSMAQYPNNLKFIVVENGKEKIITTDNKLMPFKDDRVRVWNGQLYIVKYDALKENQTWADVKKYVYKYNLDTLELSLVEEINKQSKNISTDAYKPLSNFETIIGKDGKIIYGRQYYEINKPSNTNNHYYVLFDGQNEIDLLFPFVTEYPEFYKDYFLSDFITDYKGNIWFTCTRNYNVLSPEISDPTANITEYRRRENLLKTLTNNGTIHNEKLIYKVDNKQNVTKIDMTPLTNGRGYISFWEIDKNDNIWISGCSYENNVYKYFIVKARVGEDNTLKVLEKIPLETSFLAPMNFDVNGNLWALDNGKLKKYENGNMVTKYLVYDKYHNDRFEIYDDNNLVVYGDAGYKVISANVPETNNNTSSNNNSVVVNLDLNKLNKDGMNEVNPIISNDSQTVETRIDALAVNSGTGSLKLNANKVTMELPFSTVDYDGTEQGSFISVKQNIIKNDSILSELKNIGKLFDFSLSTYKQDGSKIKDIHNFKNGKAKITVTLTNDEIKNLDMTKLGAYYYNEETKLWELVGGSFDKESMTFTFETSHFSKYTIAQTNGTLPQTGSAFNNMDLIIGGFLLILTGVLFLGRKSKLE